MRFHTRSIIHRCPVEGCKYKCVREVFSDRNVSFGIYCTRHAKEKAVDLNEHYVEEAR